MPWKDSSRRSPRPCASQWARIEPATAATQPASSVVVVQHLDLQVAARPRPPRRPRWRWWWWSTAGTAAAPAPGARRRRAGGRAPWPPTARRSASRAPPAGPAGAGCTASASAAVCTASGEPPVHPDLRVLVRHLRAAQRQDHEVQQRAPQPAGQLDHAVVVQELRKVAAHRGRGRRVGGAEVDQHQRRERRHGASTWA